MGGCHGMQAALRELDIDEDDAMELFHLLDLDDTGKVRRDDIADGIARLMGGAKAIDLAIFMNEFRRSSTRFMHHLQHVEDCMLTLQHVLVPTHLHHGARSSALAGMNSMNSEVGT